MNIIDEARSQLQARNRPAEKPWRFPVIRSDLLTYHRVLVFDGTLTNCGWAFMEAVKDGIEVFDWGTIRPKTTLVGYNGTWDKARALDDALDSPFLGSYAQNANSIVVEAPSAGGGHRTESSLIAGLVILMHYREVSVPFLDYVLDRDSSLCGFWSVSATHVSAVLLNDPKIISAKRKPAIRGAVCRLYPAAEGRDWNEHERDALATGAVHLYDEKKRETP